ncbi:hypothetical protein ACIQU4_15665 [Streptomyces sp. NPDC090741]|uniref:hypothetical protein n=1 Tax=Streptomyces sp. NPDC090741 TaxID=3365967 RepID=UPI0037F9272B
MALIRKAAAGSDSHGHVWDCDGAVVEIDDPDQIAALMAIPDAGFSEVTPSGKAEPAPAAPDPAEDDSDDGADLAADEIAEVDPKDEDVEAPKAAAKKTAARKTTASKPE